MEKQKTLILDLDDKKVEIVIAQATVGMGIKRGILIYAAMDEKEKNPELDEVDYIIGYRTLPNLVAGTVSIKGLPMPKVAGDIRDLPEGFVGEWLNAIYSLNPTWNPLSNLTTVEEKEKKGNS
jgi:hypothetical protein